MSAFRQLIIWRKYQNEQTGSQTQRPGSSAVSTKTISNYSLQISKMAPFPLLSLSSYLPLSSQNYCITCLYPLPPALSFPLSLTYI